MEQLPTAQGVERRPVPLTIMTYDGRTEIRVGETDVVSALERMTLDISGEGVYAQIVLRVDLEELDIEADLVETVAPGWEVTPEQLDHVIANCGMGSSPGAAIIAFLNEQGEKP